MTELSVAAIEELRGSLRGQLIAVGDPDYDEACKIYNAMIDKHPAIVARCTDVADVVAAVNFAREQNLLLAVRGGGHNGAGLGTCDDGLVIDLSAMNGIHVDPKARTARGGRRLPLGRCGSCNPSLWTGYADRHHLDDGGRRPHLGRRGRQSLAQVRPHHRQSA